MIPRAAAASVLAAALASLPITSPLAVDPTLPRQDHAGGLSLARRKDPAPPGLAEAEGVATLATLFNLHPGELVPLGPEATDGARFSDLLADTALRGSVEIAPRLLGLLRTLARAHLGARIDIVSGYRSPKRNEVMRKTGHHVASHSQHTLGQAGDFRVEGLGVGEIVREVEALKWDGGMGRYDLQSDLCVHVDVGPKRRWKGK